MPVGFLARTCQQVIGGADLVISYPGGAGATFATVSTQTRNNTITSVDYGGEAMTRRVQAIGTLVPPFGSDNFEAAIWTLEDPPTGTQTVTIVEASSLIKIAAVITYDGGGQAGAVDSAVSVGATGQTDTLDTSSTIDSHVVDSLYIFSTAGVDFGYMVERCPGSVATAPGRSGSTEMAWSVVTGTSPWAYCSLTIRLVVASGIGPPADAFPDEATSIPVSFGPFPRMAGPPDYDFGPWGLQKYSWFKTGLGILYALKNVRIR